MYNKYNRNNGLNCHFLKPLSGKCYVYLYQSWPHYAHRHMSIATGQRSFWEANSRSACQDSLRRLLKSVFYAFTPGSIGF